MFFSPTFKSSPHCIPSPDGRHIAVLLPSKITVRSAETLRTVHEVPLPPQSDLPAPISNFLWSPSSTKILVAGGDSIYVLGALRPGFKAVIRVPPPAAAQPTLVRFGPDDGTVCAFSALGLKYSIFNLATSKVVEIINPKFYQALSAGRCAAFRPRTGHLAIITRTAGRDAISLHDPGTWDVSRSFHPDTVDVQGLMWSSDGRWLVVWESASQGHKVLIYTADGHLFRTWNGPSAAVPSPELQHVEMGAGVKRCCLSPDASRMAVCDYSRFVYVLEVLTGLERTRLHHPTSAITPRDTLQIWQEQLTPVQGTPARLTHTFTRVTQPVAPPAPPPPTNTSASEPAQTGGSSACFDASSSLLATKIDDSPTTLWIWDLAASELRAVLIFSSDVSSFRWHPSIPEMLMVTCLGGDASRGVVYVWDPLCGGPRAADCAEHFPGGKVAPKWQASWLAGEQPGVILVADKNRYQLVSLAEGEDAAAPWGDVEVSPSTTGVLSSGLRSGLDLESLEEMEDVHYGDAGPEDTFAFKRAF